MAGPRRFGLAALPTPLQRAHRLERALAGPPVWIKRDDLTGLAVAGNKARPLEYLIGDALAERADTLLVTGSVSSNFCAAAAIAAGLAGLDCEVLHPGAEPVQLPTTVQLSRAAGASVRFEAELTRHDLDPAVRRRADRLRVAGRRPYPVPRGGATAVGALGFARGARELAAQCAEQGIDRCTVVLATGSGATQAGLLAGLAGLADTASLRVVGASVSRPADKIRPALLALARECAQLFGAPGPDDVDVDVREAVGAGFGLASPEDCASAALALRTEGLLLDDSYTAKAMTLLRTLAEADRDPLVFWHTGGLAGALAQIDGRMLAEQRR